ncbi:acyltransferase [Pantoea ananatis]|nr:acyltransferase [Pantoea ananatis]
MPSSISEVKMKYRSDIDGLRAVAVTLVILFHAGLSVIASGFVGVDIFFVISGFLITKIILDSYSEGKFSLSAFYNRRIWRLQPSLLVVVFFAAILGSVFYLPDDYNTFLHSIKNLLYFSSNRYFSDVTTTYASEDANYLILLHTWSLSVEWQWYLCFPVLLLIALKYAGNSGAFYINCAATLFLTSYALYVSATSHTDHYYDLLTRCFELQAGSCLAFGRLKLRGKAADITGIGSLAVLIAIALKGNVLPAYPNVFTVFIVLATGAVILSGETTLTASSRLLSSRVMVWAGKRSYSFYLWHWPGIAVLHYMKLFGNKMLVTGVLGTSLLLACLSYRFIEMPFRRNQKPLRATFGWLMIFPLLISLGLYAAARKDEFFPWRFGSAYAHATALQLEYKNLSGHRSDCLTDDVEGKYPDDYCTFGPADAKNRAFFIGDSNANHYWMFLDVLAKNAGLRITARSTATCLTLPGLYQYDWWFKSRNTTYDQCHINTQKYYQDIESGKYKYVIIGELWPMYVSDKILNHPGDSRSLELAKARLDKALREAFDIIVKSGARPVIMKEIYTRPEGYEACVKEHLIRRESILDGSCNIPKVTSPPRSWFDGEFTALKKDYPSLIIIDIKDAQCAHNLCVTEVKGSPIYRDVGHLNDYAAHIFGEEYLKMEGNPFTDKRS